MSSSWPQSLGLVRAARPKSLVNWADMSDVGSQDDEVSESSSRLDSISNISTTPIVSIGKTESWTSKKAEETTTKKSCWADMSDDVDSEDDRASDTSSRIATASTVSVTTTSSGQAEKRKTKLINRPLSRIEAMLSLAATHNASCDTTSESSVTISDSTESTGASIPLKVPAADKVFVMSLGSANHDEGNCKPCLFVHTNFGCQNGSLCEFCHFQHKRKAKQRPCKAKRDRYKKLLTRMNDDGAESPDEMDPPIDASSLQVQVNTANPGDILLSVEPK